nr:thioesterase domain-containing protein [uncultured Rhodopila sp.]
MMDTASLLSNLRERDVRLWVDDGRIKCSAPAGALDAETRATLASRKQEILAFLHEAEALKSTPAAIVPIKPGGRLPPLFIVSGYRGDVFFMLPLARHLDPEQPVLGVQPPGLDGSEPLASVESLARFQVEQIRRYRPNGPYLLGGHCSGGTIAFEIAQQLTASGQEVAFLGLIGSPFPTAFLPLARFASRLTSGSLAERKQKIMRRLQKLIRPPERVHQPEAPPEVSSMTKIDLRVGGATLAAVRAYRPRRYDGEIDQFVSGEEWHHANRWRAFARTVRQHSVGSLDIEEILRGPEVSVLAAALQKRLDSIASKAAA